MSRMLGRIGAALVAAIALLALTTSAVAGGWAVTTFDQLPAEFHAGQPYALGYTIRQHGQTPIHVDRTEIVVSGSDGTTVFTGTPEGAIGHYVARVTFPATGAYSWRVTQGAFAPQELGSVIVTAGTGAAPSDTARTAPLTTDPVRGLLPFAAAAAALLFAWRLVTFAGTLRRRTVAAP